MKQVVKRNGDIVDFDRNKIISAIEKAFLEVDGDITDSTHKKAKEIAKYIEDMEQNSTVEKIQDIVEDKLMASNRKDGARAYVR